MVECARACACTCAGACTRARPVFSPTSVVAPDTGPSLADSPCLFSSPLRAVGGGVPSPCGRHAQFLTCIACGRGIDGRRRRRCWTSVRAVIAVGRYPLV